MACSLQSTASKVQRSFSSDENDEILMSDPLLLKELGERKSTVSKKVVFFRYCLQIHLDFLVKAFSKAMRSENQLNFKYAASKNPK